MKIGIITGSGLGASLVYKDSPKPLILKDIDLKSLLQNGYDGLDPTPFYREVVRWFKNNGITHGSVGCNTFNNIGLRLFEEYDITPINSITGILFNEVRKYSSVGWISTSNFRRRLPNDMQITHISEEDQCIIDRIIFEELAWGVVKQASILEIRRIVRQLNCKDVVFGCTDLSLIRDKMDTHIIDSVQLHLEKFK